MAVSYPLTPPPEPAPVQSRLRLRAATALVGGEVSPVQRAYLWAGGERWELEIELPPMRRQLAELWISFVLSLDGPWGTFLYGDPDAKKSLGAYTGTILVAGANQSGEDLNVDGAAAAQKFTPGDYLQIGNYYGKIVKPATADGGGAATLTLRPRFGMFGRASPADNAVIEYRNPRGLWRLGSADQGQWTADRVSTYGLNFSAIESLEA